MTINFLRKWIAVWRKIAYGMNVNSNPDGFKRAVSNIDKLTIELREIEWEITQTRIKNLNTL